MAAEEGSEVSEERILVVNLKKLVWVPRTQRAPRAVRLLRSTVQKATKAEKVEVSNEVNELIWSRGIEKPPHKVRVKLVKDEEGRVTVFPV